MKEIEKSDIVGISETHIYNEVLDELDIPNFIRLGYKNRKKQAKANKSSGGVAVFAKYEIANIVELHKTKNDDIIWIKIKQENLDRSKYVYIGTAYVSDENRKKTISEKIQGLSKDIEDIKDKGGEVILQGDLNARTAQERDWVDNDKYDPEMSPVSYELSPRSSLDKVLDPKGKELLDICKTNELCIVNGRKTGDILGNFTSFQPNGSSVIDYGIVSQSLFESVLSFSVGNFKPWLSDHCPIHYVVGTRICRSNSSENDQTEPQPTKWYWDEDCSEKFENILKMDNISAKLNRIRNSSDANNMVEGINSLLSETAVDCHIKKKKRKTSNPNAPWYDRDCQNMKENMIRIAKNVKKHPYDPKLIEELYALKMSYKSTILSKKKKYKEEIMNQMTCNRRNSRFFWKLLDKLNAKNNDNLFKSGISGKRWKSHFQELFTKNADDTPIPNSPSTTGPLDYDISSEELEDASYILRNGKSTGKDGILNEMIRCLLNTHPDIILRLFNTILSSGLPVLPWNTSIFSPIHKKGSKMDPDNYRAIALSCCLSKFYAAILNRRLLNFAIENNIIHKSQLGFMPGNRCSDAMIILYNLFVKYCKQRNGYMYGCFVDFRKAFDTIPRHLLFQKLLSHNITEKFYDSIDNMYTQALACIPLGEEITSSFRINQGVKQGCILSPLLFNIFLADLPDQLNHGDARPVQINDTESLNSLIWADDLLILSESESGLNTMLQNLLSYTQKNLMHVNLDKTKCMIFNKTGRLIRRTFSFGNTRLEMVKEYKYLGFLVTPSFNITTALVDLKDRGLRAYGALKAKLGISFRKHIPTTLYLFDSLIKPILLYASDFWATLKLPQNNPVELLHRKFCKQLLGVNLQTTNNAVYLELGRLPLEIYAKKNAAKNWDRIFLQQIGNELLLASCNVPSENNWISTVRNTFEKVDMLDTFLNENPSDTTTPFSALFYQEKDIFISTALESIQNMSKMKTYAFLKQSWKIEDYLLQVQNVKNRTALTKLRLSDHTLAIEKGRHQDIIQCDRKCPFCPENVEDEFHFLIKCPVYKSLRESLFDDINILCIGFFYPLDERFLMWFLVNNPIISESTAKYTRLSMELRSFLLEQHKNWI